MINFTKSDNKKKYVYDLSNPHDKEAVKLFEMELGDRSFEQYAKDMNYVFMRNGIEYVNGDLLVDYNDAREKRKALDILRSQRYKAEKHEHEEQLSGEPCGSKTRCKYCEPMTLKEVIAMRGNPTRQMVHE